MDARCNDIALTALPYSCLTDHQDASADQPTKLVSNLTHCVRDMKRHAQLHVDVQRVLGHVRARDESHPVVHDQALGVQGSTFMACGLALRSLGDVLLKTDD